MNVKILCSGFETQLKVKHLITVLSADTVTKRLLLSISDVSDLQRFVNVALTIAAGGENDLSNDKLSNLRTVGSGFASLIYGLKADTGFRALCDKCSSVWAAYEKNKNLLKMLVWSVSVC